MDSRKVIENYFAIGMDTDHSNLQLQPGQVGYARNAIIENFDGSGVTYQNENANELCFKPKAGYRVIGSKNILEQGKTIFFMVSETGESEIGFKNNSNCQYQTILNGRCLNFSMDHPIKKVIIKSTNCSNQLFFTDAYNPVRWIDLDKLPVKVNADGSQDIDCNKLRLQPNFSTPQIRITGQKPGGSLKMGAYQFCLQYANSKGDGFSAFYGITNPAGVFEVRVSEKTDLPTAIALNIQITNLDTSSLFEFFNLVALATIDGVTTPKLVGTFAITNSKFDYTYTGNSHAEISLSIDEIFQRFPYYPYAKDITTVDNTLFLADVTTPRRINYQQIWSKVRLTWETYRIPYNQFEGYFSAVNTAEYRGYLRDEIYDFQAMFVLRNGQFTDSFHIPGRESLPSDLEIVDNDDSRAVIADPCTIPEKRQYWQVYNTATMTGYSKQYQDLLSDSGCTDCNVEQQSKLKCYKGPFQQGTFGYWQSSLTYPDDKGIWGPLAGQFIRHHKMPDCNLAPLHDNNESNISGFEHAIYALGVKIDAASLYAAIQASDLTETEKNEIVGFKIVRSNRASNNCVVSKGILYNVGSYERDGEKRYYPNYPYNDLSPDVFLSSRQVPAHSGGNPAPLNGFSEEAKLRYTFHSPDTSFAQPFINAGFLNLETIISGKSQGHFVEVKDNAKYKFLTRQGLYLAFASGLASMVSLDTGGGFMGVAPSAKIDASPVPAVFSATLDLVKNIAPWRNYGFQYNSIGNYNKSVGVPHSGNKVRMISSGAYLNSTNTSIDGELINNYQRESSVFLRLSAPLPFPHQHNGLQIPVDNSRGLPDPEDSKLERVQIRDISSYYGSIKREVPDQYGSVYSAETIDTGYYQQTLENGKQYSEFPTIFGGDTYLNRFSIKRKLPFFLDHTVGKTNGTDIDQDLLGNVAYPAFFYSTSPINDNVDFSSMEGEVDNIVNVSAGNIIVNILSGGVRPVASGIIIMAKLLQGYINNLGVANTNLDNYSKEGVVEKGRSYLFCYGVPYFFCESTINLDQRQATNDFEGSFYPVSEFIPDDWLQESRVSIIHDNKYTYNDSYSKQIKEIYLSHLPVDYNPDKKCNQNYQNRIIYSERENLEEKRNNWLIFRPISYFDTPKSYGHLTAIDGLEDRKILARFESKSLLYNVLNTINTGTGGQAFLGDNKYFSNPSLDFAETDTGFNGSQHSMLIRTPKGHLTVDAIRGQIFLMAEGAEEISSYGMRQFFSENLPFTISRYFPDVDTDNAWKDIGITGCYDGKYQRFLITKKDFQPVTEGITYSNGKFFHSGKQIQVTDQRFFCNRSWTLSYHTGLKKWISFHGYIPDYFNAHPDGFESGIASGLFDHRNSIRFNNFYGKTDDYVIEYALAAQGIDQILSSVSSYTEVRKYINRQVWISPPQDIFFDKAVLYNLTQCSGTLYLVAKPAGNLAILRKYPKLREDGKEILFTRKDGIISFNTFYDTVADPNFPFYTISCDGLPQKKFINLDYSTLSHKKARLRGKQHIIQLSYNQSDQFHLITHFNLAEIQNSVI